MKKGPHVGVDPGAEDDLRGAVEPVPFNLISITRCDFGAKQAEGVLEIPGVAAVMAFDFFAPLGKSTFVAPKSVRSKYSGVYERSMTLDPEFAARLLKAVEQALERVEGDR